VDPRTRSAGQTADMIAGGDPGPSRPGVSSQVPEPHLAGPPLSVQRPSAPDLPTGQLPTGALVGIRPVHVTTAAGGRGDPPRTAACLLGPDWFCRTFPWLC